MIHCDSLRDAVALSAHCSPPIPHSSISDSQDSIRHAHIPLTSLDAYSPNATNNTLTFPPTASWSWNGAHPSGEVAEKKTDGDLAITSSRGNTIKASGSPSDPAVHLARPGNDVVKKQSDLTVESKGDGHLSAESKEKAEKSKAAEDPDLHMNGNGGAGDDDGGSENTTSDDAPAPKTGDKRKAATEEPEADDGGDAQVPSAKKSRGRPKKDGAASAAATPKAKAAAPAKKVDSEKKKPGRKPAAEKMAPAAAKKEAAAPKKAAVAAKKDAPGEGGKKKGRGRPKKDGSAAQPRESGAKKAKKPAAKPVAGSMGTRTRSRA